MANPLGEVDSETLMNCVQNYPVLYDKGSADYKIPLRKKNAWKEIAAKLGIDQTEAKTRYNSIRTNFSKYIRKLRDASRSGAGRNDLPEIKGEYEHLRWLLNHIKHRQGTSNFSRRPEVAVTGVGSWKEND